jgi:hypothetical protein
MKNLTLQEILNIKFKTVLTYNGSEAYGYRNEKTLEFGNWVISRDGKYNKDGVFINWAGDWVVSRGEKTYSTKKTLKLAKRYIKGWLQGSPTDY